VTFSLTMIFPMSVLLLLVLSAATAGGGEMKIGLPFAHLAAF
jgi:hypothetical protein